MTHGHRTFGASLTWHDWNGKGFPPIDPNTPVYVRLACGEVSWKPYPAKVWCWLWTGPDIDNRIIAYAPENP